MLLEKKTGKTGDEVRACTSQLLLASLLLSSFAITDFLFSLLQMLSMMHQLLGPMWKILHRRNIISLVLLPGIN
jgi:hypothetical protein